MRYGRAHCATAEQETERHVAAQRLAELIERREELYLEPLGVDDVSYAL